MQSNLAWFPVTRYRKQVLKDGDVFRILNVTKSDGGFYKCNATHIDGHASIAWPDGYGFVVPHRNKSSMMNIYPSTSDMGDIIITEEENQNITCESTLAVSLEWEKGSDGVVSQPVSANKIARIKDRQMNTQKSILMITNAIVSDGGKYECVQTNTYNQTHTMTAALRVLGRYR